jgi:hypothetical protein
MCLLSNFTRCLAILYVGAFTLLITSLIGILVLCSFSCAFKVGGDGFCCIRYFIFFLSMIRLHCCNVLCISCWYLVVVSFWIRWKLLSVINVCTFLEYSLAFVIKIVFLCQPGQLLRSPLQVFGSTSLYYIAVSSVWFCGGFLTLTKGLK